MKSESWYSSPVSHLATRMFPPGGSQPGRPNRANRLPLSSAASPPFRPPLSALAAAASQQPPEKQPRPRAGPSRHTTSLRSLSRCFIALQPRSPPARSPQPRSASCASTALRSTLLRLSSARGNHSTQQERCQYSHPRPGQRGGEPAPRGRARPISGRRSPGSPSGAQPAGPPAPSRTRSAVQADYRCGRATWWVTRGPAGHHPGTCKTRD